METTGTFVAEDAFFITGRGWVLLGQLSGTVVSGQQLVLAIGIAWRIKGVHKDAKHSGKTGLLLEATFESRQQLLESGVLGVAAVVST